MYVWEPHEQESIGDRKGPWEYKTTWTRGEVSALGAAKGPCRMRRADAQ